MNFIIKFICSLCLLSLIACKNHNNYINPSKSKTISTYKLTRVEPPNWWVDLKNNKLQLLVYETAISTATVSVDYDGLSIEKQHSGQSANYLFIDLLISATTLPGSFDFVFKFDNGDKKKHTYELKTREKPSQDFIGFDSSDVIYLITPDRFANGNPQIINDKLLKDSTINRSLDDARHGGDIRGMINHLDYIEQMGFTAIWPSPLLINDMFEGSYHGYAITDFYMVDPRFGSLDDYIELVDKAREKGIKIIMDQVANHCGLEHWWIKDLPFSDWINNQKDFEEQLQTKHASHRRTVNQDLYASELDKSEMHQGWFVDAMPDLNQANPFMAKYTIQNSIWWIETLGLGGIRQDTYPYPDKEFMASWAKAIMDEYPNFNIVGEEWSYNPLLIGYWQKGANNKDGYQSHLRTTMDFAMQRQIIYGLNEEEGWDTGLIKLYEGLANDFAYTKPKDIMIFLDNHDMDRVFTQFHENATLTKMALAYMLCLPRIPQIYYGTEILMQNSSKPGDHGLIRTDFPGGWLDDTSNAFTGEGLNQDQLDMQSFLKKILNYRKSSLALSKGSTLHFVPQEGVYLLFRKYQDEIVLCLLNKNNDQKPLSLNRFSEMGIEGKKMRELVSDSIIDWDGSLSLEGKGVMILSTKLD